MLASLKPVISALVLPPGGPLLLLALVMLLQRWWPSLRKITWLALLLLWFSFTQGFAVWLQTWITPPEFTPKPWLLHSKPPAVQAVVVLGGGVRQADEWPQRHSLTPNALTRLTYGAALARAWKLPLAFSGGMGWAAATGQTLSEAQVAEATLVNWGQNLTWLDSGSRDTHENATHSARLLLSHGIHHIALVTHAWHMPRAQRAFETAVCSHTHLHRSDRGQPAPLSSLASQPARHPRSTLAHSRSSGAASHPTGRYRLSQSSNHSRQPPHAVTQGFSTTILTHRSL